MKGELTKEKKEGIQNKIMSLLLCILYEPEKIPWIEMKKIAIYFEGTQILGPKNINKIALCMYQLYNKAVSLNKEKQYVNENSSLKQLIEIEYLNLVSIYNQILNYVDKKALEQYLCKKAEVVLNEAKKMIDANEIVIKGPRFDLVSYTEYLYNNLTIEIKDKTENRLKKIYHLTKVLSQELEKNKIAIETNQIPNHGKEVKPIINDMEKTDEEVSAKALLLIEKLQLNMENTTNVAKYDFFKDCIEELEESLAKKEQVLETILLTEGYLEQLKR